MSDHNRIYQRNFKYFLIDGILFGVAMGIIGPTTVIPDFVRRLTNSEILIGFSASMFEVGWMMPQLFMARYLVSVTHKKWWFVGPNIPVRFAVLILGVLIFLLGSDHPGLILAAFFVCYGIAGIGDGLVGVPWADLIGNSLDDRLRTRFLGLLISLSGIIMLGMSLVIGYILSDNGPGFPNNYGLLFGMAGILFVISSFPVIFVHEIPTPITATRVPTFREFIPQLGHLLRNDTPFRAMIVTRWLSSLFMMAAPFYIGFATEQLGVSNARAVRDLLAMQTTGVILGSFSYAWLGVKHNLLYIRLALITLTLWPISALLAGILGAFPLYGGFFAAGLALGSLGMSYLNWVIMHATPDQRPIYTGLFNTMAAVSILVTPFIGGSIVQFFGYEAVFVGALVTILAALYVVVVHVDNPQATRDSAEPALVALS